MGIAYNTSIVSDGLVFALDAANSRCYSGSGITVNSLIGGTGSTLVNGTGFSSANNGSFFFDGTNDYINVPNNSTLNSNITTVSVWFQYSTVNNYYGTLISKADPSGTYNGWNIYIYNNVINAQIKRNPGPGDTTDIPGTTISTNVWYNITLVSVSGGTSYLYLNNVAVKFLCHVTSTFFHHSP